MEKIIKNDAGKISLNQDNKILKTRPFTETVLQDGLSFLGSAADPAYLTLVNGLVSEAYDIRGNGNKMIQNTILNRPQLIGNYLNCVDIKKLTMSNASAKSMFIVISGISTNNSDLYGIGYGEGGSASNWITLGKQYNITQYSHCNAGINQKIFYANLSKGLTSPVGYKILHTLNDPLIVNTIISVGSLYSATSNCKIYEWGWYNRILNETEVLYNINALNTKYSIF